MADGRPIAALRQPPADQAEQDFRRRWYEAHCRHFEADANAHAHSLQRQADFATSADEALPILSTLGATRDLDAFHESLKQWAVKPTTLAFNGFSGQMLVNQLVKRSEDPVELADVFVDALTVPSDDDEARRKLQRIVGYIEQIRVGAHPAPGHATFLVSYFWALQDHELWSTLWASAASFVEFLTGSRLPTEPDDRYLAYLDVVRLIDLDFGRFERTASWWETAKPVLLDAVLVDRCTFGLDTAVPAEARGRNADALVAVSGHLAARLVDTVSASAGRSLSAVRAPRMWTEEYRGADCWAEWRAGDNGPAVRVWITNFGAFIGLVPGQVRPGWLQEITPLIEAANLPGFQRVDARGAEDDSARIAGGRPGEFIYGKRFAPEALRQIDLEHEATAATVELQPLLDDLVRRATGGDREVDGDPLAPFVDEFARRTGYPTEGDSIDKAERARFAELLAPDALALADPAALRRIWTTGVYGSPGPQSVLNTTFRNAIADAAEYERVIDTIRHLCWGDGDDAARLDEVLDKDGDRYVKGLGEAVAMKFLAVCHPDRYIPVYPYAGPEGKLAMLTTLDLPVPEGTRGQLQVKSNALLRDRLGRFFPGDTWAMMRFCYWYRERPTDDDVVIADPIEGLAENLLVDRSFLDDVVALLEDKRQVILYGPPGTGKTYLAQKLAEALVPDPTRRSLVQFHPSMSYEDFFEGYRPETTDDGQLSYRLTPGPLALLAERARKSPGKRHIMIIDEINRANLPRVLGELLFLLEYRNRQVPTLYRPDDPFELPSDLWFIGTMNTADRSIALVDAALRRRFHFVPFFPNYGAIEGLLDRWLAKHGEPAWIGELVALANEQLTEALGGPHLQIGPSYFMKERLDEAAVRRIWAYNIEPFIEDQFFGDPAQIERFRFDNVLTVYLGTVAVGSLAELDEVIAQDEGTAPSMQGVEAGDDVDVGTER